MTPVSSESTPQRILVVDDEPMLRQIERRVLESSGFVVQEAATGLQAIEMWQQERHDLVLLDVRMPGIDGFQTCERIRATPGGENVPVILVTGLDDSGSIRRAYDTGATDFLTKPLSMLLLENRTRYALRAAENIRRLQDSERRLATAQRIANLGHWYLDRTSMRLRLSDQMARMYGADPTSSWIDLDVFSSWVHESSRDSVRASIERCLGHGRTLSLDHGIATHIGPDRIIHLNAEVIRDDLGSPCGLEGTAQDVTDRKVAENQIRHLAYHDSLTGLGNRRMAQDRLAAAVAAAKRHDRKLALLFLDLDKFKRVNDTLGHSLGDSMLQETSRRLMEAVRSSDCVARIDANESHAVSRLGGDEFTVLLSEIRDPHDAAIVARRILAALSQPFMLQGHEVVMSTSIGLTVFPNDGDDPETLMRNADAAMYDAKESGRGTYKFYSHALNEVAVERLSLEEGLRRAIERDELRLFWQPIIEASSGHAVGAEALVRWLEPSRGLVPPDEFIPLAEDTGLIIPVGDWVLRAACAQIRDWRAEGARPLRVAVNLSPVQLAREGFADRVAEILAEHQIDASQIELEITERTLMRSEGTVEANLRALRALGLRLALDDFGTGYSSLSYLRRFRFDVLKIDRTFVRDVTANPGDSAITSAILSMSHALGLKVVAEGVETEEQRVYLADQGCDLMQGYLFSKPVEARLLSRFLERSASVEAEPWRARAPRGGVPATSSFEEQAELAA